MPTACMTPRPARPACLSHRCGGRWPRPTAGSPSGSGGKATAAPSPAPASSGSDEGWEEDEEGGEGGASAGKAPAAAAAGQQAPAGAGNPGSVLSWVHVKDVLQLPDKASAGCWGRMRVPGTCAAGTLLEMGVAPCSR